MNRRSSFSLSSSSFSFSDGTVMGDDLIRGCCCDEVSRNTAAASASPEDDSDSAFRPCLPAGEGGSGISGVRGDDGISFPIIVSFPRSDAEVL